MLHGFFITLTGLSTLFAAFSSSPSYQLQNYGLGSGGTSNSSSSGYRLNASSGELGSTPTTGATSTQVGSGTTQVRQANQPLAPTLSNGSNSYYNKLIISINTSGSDATDYTYSIAVSTNNFTNTSYVQADGTLGATPVYQTYSAWGGASGSPITGLSPNTVYKAKVNARQAGFTDSAYGTAASSTTANPALVFSVSPTTVSLGKLLPGTVTSGSSDISLTFATNAASGGSVYAAGAYGGLKSTAANYTIASASTDLSTQSQGFGLIGLTKSNTSGATPSFTAPYNGSGTNIGLIASNFQPLLSATGPITGGAATVGVRGKAALVTPSASDYSEIVTFIASASF